ncbi:AmmeMemoRadiSam system protein B [Thioalkalivibrio paradoxus]|uniref:MEMO1 family protein THITH_07405 n=1 Tax=Thioalkalivibrio paradoxus ARh 1 TaxID=713585 RepID=W0DLH8_9GAMM|nr:AmmeMemoRadiSam system protein B [Thioalkalivibrio paradoxus]AHE98117.1 dioxygenase [Thioalkalivibrio paradoxus ARh 1]
MQATETVRDPAVAGLFYPDDPAALRRAVQALMADATGPAAGRSLPKALIAPHAGYRYSGPVAASAYAALGNASDRIQRVVLLGPSHRVPFRGIAATGAGAYRTPLGTIAVDRPALASIRELPGVVTLDLAHGPEHSLEVHLPFLQLLLGNFNLVPLVVGDAGPEQVAAVLERLWGGPETLIVVSSDLSHYHDYRTAQTLDAETCRAIEAMQDESLTPERACGCRPLAGLLRAARAHRLTVHTLDLRNSGDTAGPRSEVVGYGAWTIQ